MKRIISLSLILCLIFSVVGCGKKDTVGVNMSSPTVRIDFSDAGELSDEEYANIERALTLIETPDISILSKVRYGNAKDFFNEIFTLDIESIPVIVCKMNDFQSNGHSYEKHFDLNRLYAEAIWYQLRVYDECFFDISENAINRFQKESISDFWHSSANFITDTINSDSNIDTKVLSLSKCGLISLPYVVEQINNGHTEYEDYFALVGIHLSAKEWTEKTEDDFLEVVQNTADGSTIWEQQLETIKKDYGDFDYKVWLSENEDDLNMALKYMDNFCAEYEAEIAGE